jgi:hypothetical protein
LAKKVTIITKIIAKVIVYDLLPVAIVFIRATINFAIRIRSSCAASTACIASTTYIAGWI